MRILRLGHSGDNYHAVAETDRSYNITARAIEAAIGEPVETTCRVLWPAPSLPDLVESWIDRFEPDIVLFWPNAYWFSYVDLPPPPPKSKRKLVKAAGRLAARAHVKKPLVLRATKLRMQVLVARGVGRELFEPEEMIELGETIVRRVLRHEEVSLIVRGYEWPTPTRSPGVLNHKMLARAEARRRKVDRALGVLCGQLHIPFWGAEDGLRIIREGYVGADGMHPNEKNHARMAVEETEVILKIWEESGRAGARPARGLVAAGVR